MWLSSLQVHTPEKKVRRKQAPAMQLGGVENVYQNLERHVFLFTADLAGTDERQ